MTVLLVGEDREYLCQPGEELGTDLGVLAVPNDVEPGDTVETHLGESFVAVRPRGTDLFRHMERTGAPMLPRDVGLVVGVAGIESGDRVLDAGTGTGVLAAYLGRIGAGVVSFERNPGFAETARENMALAGVDDRVEVRSADITDHLNDIGGFSAMTLDTADAASVVARAPELLEPGSPVAIYSPFVEDARAAATAARDAGLSEVTTLDTVQRQMTFDDRGSRPQTGGVGHSGYLTVARFWA